MLTHYSCRLRYHLPIPNLCCHPQPLPNSLLLNVLIPIHVPVIPNHLPKGCEFQSYLFPPLPGDLQVWRCLSLQTHVHKFSRRNILCNCIMESGDVRFHFIQTQIQEVTFHWGLWPSPIYPYPWLYSWYLSWHPVVETAQEVAHMWGHHRRLWNKNKDSLNHFQVETSWYFGVTPLPC